MALTRKVMNKIHVKKLNSQGNKSGGKQSKKGKITRKRRGGGDRLTKAQKTKMKQIPKAHEGYEKRLDKTMETPDFKYYKIGDVEGPEIYTIRDAKNMRRDGTLPRDLLTGAGPKTPPPDDTTPPPDDTTPPPDDTTPPADPTTTPTAPSSPTYYGPPELNPAIDKSEPEPEPRPRRRTIVKRAPPPPLDIPKSPEKAPSHPFPFPFPAPAAPAAAAPAPATAPAPAPAPAPAAPSFPAPPAAPIRRPLHVRRQPPAAPAPARDGKPASQILKEQEARMSLANKKAQEAESFHKAAQESLINLDIQQAQKHIDNADKAVKIGDTLTSQTDDSVSGWTPQHSQYLTTVRSHLSNVKSVIAKEKTNHAKAASHVFSHMLDHLKSGNHFVGGPRGHFEQLRQKYIETRQGLGN